MKAFFYHTLATLVTIFTFVISVIGFVFLIFQVKAQKEGKVIDGKNQHFLQDDDPIGIGNVA